MNDKVNFTKFFTTFCHSERSKESQPLYSAFCTLNSAFTKILKILYKIAHYYLVTKFFRSELNVEKSRFAKPSV